MSADLLREVLPGDELAGVAHSETEVDVVLLAEPGERLLDVLVVGDLEPAEELAYAVAFVLGDFVASAHAEPHDHVLVEEVALVVEARLSVGLEDLEQDARLAESPFAEFLLDQREDIVGAVADGVVAGEVLDEEVLEQLELVLVELFCDRKIVVLDEDREERTCGLRVDVRLTGGLAHDRSGEDLQGFVAWLQRFLEAWSHTLEQGFEVGLFLCSGSGGGSHEHVDDLSQHQATLTGSQASWGVFLPGACVLTGTIAWAKNSQSERMITPRMRPDKMLQVWRRTLIDCLRRVTVSSR